MEFYQTKLAEKLKEALTAVLPIIGLVLLLSFTIAPVPPSILLLFLFGAVLLVVGMMLFTLGAELAMTPMGKRSARRWRTPEDSGLYFSCAFSLGSSLRSQNRIFRCWRILQNYRI